MSDPRDGFHLLEFVRHIITRNHTRAQATQRALYKLAAEFDNDIAEIDAILEELAQLSSEAGDWSTNPDDYAAHVLGVFHRWYESRQTDAEIGEIFSATSASVSTSGSGESE